MTHGAHPFAGEALAYAFEISFQLAGYAFHLDAVGLQLPGGSLGNCLAGNPTPVFGIGSSLQHRRAGVGRQRFKGLGEMNAKQLFETTMDPNKRTLLQIKLDESNAQEAERIFTILMGDVVEPRKHFIEENALNVRNLDV